MFEIFTQLFWFRRCRGSKNPSNMKKYTSKSSSGYELYRGMFVFLPLRCYDTKKQLRRQYKNLEVLEARVPGIPSCINHPMTFSTFPSQFLFLSHFFLSMLQACNRKGVDLQRTSFIFSIDFHRGFFSFTNLSLFIFGYLFLSIQ